MIFYLITSINTQILSIILSKMQPLLNISGFYENLINKFIFTQDNQTISEIDNTNVHTNIYVRLLMIYLIIIGIILMLLIRLKN